MNANAILSHPEMRKFSDLVGTVLDPFEKSVFERVLRSAVERSDITATLPGMEEDLDDDVKITRTVGELRETTEFTFSAGIAVGALTAILDWRGEPDV